MRRMEQKTERQISERARKVSLQAERAARAKEPVVGNAMGSKQRLGDKDITSSARD